jgi:hypothetical protein
MYSQEQSIRDIQIAVKTALTFAFMMVELTTTDAASPRERWLSLILESSSWRACKAMNEQKPCA